MEILFGLLLEFGAAIVEGLLEAALGAAFEKTFSRFKKIEGLVGAVVYLLLGAALGLLLAILLPNRLLSPVRFRGTSLIVSPIVAGTVMSYLGVFRRSRGGSPSFIGTFWGGACFAFGVALVRFLMMG